ncbi:MAG: TetR/AcrR family transcriptional regulator [Thermonemataceae bacterium]|nr:TetR/AcrR family transcriptional regulator [Thermonemataceae bacterium]
MYTITDRQFEIIEAAGKILTKEGVSGLTIKNLANEMQFSESAVYRHFKSKEDIIVALLNYLAENINERLGKVIENGQSPMVNFRAIFANQFSFFQKHPYFVVAVFSDGLMEESQKINTAIHKIMEVKMRYLLPIVMQGQQQGVFSNKITTEELVHIIMGVFRFQMFKWRIANFQFDIERQGSNTLESLITLIKA